MTTQEIITKQRQLASKSRPIEFEEIRETPLELVRKICEIEEKFIPMARKIADQTERIKTIRDLESKVEELFRKKRVLEARQNS